MANESGVISRGTAADSTDSAHAGGAVFHELTRSLCPECRRVVDAKVLLRDGAVFMHKRCPQHGAFEARVYGDAEAYVDFARFNRPGTVPEAFSTEVSHGCPHDCGLCPDHEQHACVGIIEVNSACDMDCPLCFADAGRGYSLTLAEVEAALDSFVRTEAAPEVVQFSGGEPSIHPQIGEMMRAASKRGIRHVMLNTNGRRIARDDAFLDELADIRPAIYFQFDGFDADTNQKIRGEPDLLDEKLRALDRLAAIGCPVVLVPAIEWGVNEHEVGRIVEFGLEHPAVFGINFQPAFHAGRYGDHDPLQRVTNPDILSWIEEQTDGRFLVSDFFPVPCCFPTCNSATYAYVEDGEVTPLPRILPMEDYMDYIANRVLMDVPGEMRRLLEELWSAASIPGTGDAAYAFDLACAACGLPQGLGGIEDIAGRMFMITLQDFMDPWTFNQKNVMKCCKEILLPDGKQIPFCAYNSVGYREQAREQLAARQPDRDRARRTGEPLEIQPLRFEFDHPGTEA